MPAEIDLIVGLIEIPRAYCQLRFVISLEARARQNIEDTVRAIAEVRRITPALHFDGIDVFGIDLWPKVAGDICVGNRDAVNQPAHLVASTHV